MANRLLRNVSLAGIFLASGCIGPSRPQAQEIAPSLSDLFVTIEWYGPESKPIQEVGFASENKMFDLQQWISGRPVARVGAVLSQQQCSSLVLLLKGRQFAEHETGTLPADISARPQYIVICRTANQTLLFYPLGFDRTTDDSLLELKRAIGGVDGALLDPLIAFAKMDTDLGGEHTKSK